MGTLKLGEVEGKAKPVQIDPKSVMIIRHGELNRICTFQSVFMCLFLIFSLTAFSTHPMLLPVSLLAPQRPQFHQW